METAEVLDLVAHLGVYSINDLPLFLSVRLPFLYTFHIFLPVLYLLPLLPEDFCILLNILSCLRGEAVGCYGDILNGTVGFGETDEGKEVLFGPGLEALGQEAVTRSEVFVCECRRRFR